MSGGMGDAGSGGMTGWMWMPDDPVSVGGLFAFHPQPVPILPLLGLAMLLAYLAGVLLLRRRGDRWPIGRLAWWTLGVLTIELMTATGFDGYGMELFSVHMLQHMVLGMLTPILLCLGAPMTLLLRVLPARPGRSARGLLLRVIHSRFVQFWANPVTTLVLFLFSLYGLYFTPIFDLLMHSMWGHNLMLIHFLAIGLLYFWGVLGVDPSPRRGRGLMGAFGRPAMRVVELIVPIPFHAFFGVAIMMASTLVVRFYADPNPAWHLDPLADQQVAGGIAWGITEAPTLLVLGVLITQWQRSDARRERGAERRARRGGDTELDAYNEHLAALADRDRRVA